VRQLCREFIGRNKFVTAVITLFNQAGGVGKSTLTINIGYHLAELGCRVLLVDMDPQASLTIFMGLEPSDLDKTVYDALMNEEAMPIHHDIYGMALAPSNLNLCLAEQELVTADMRDTRLKEALGALLKDYDFILIDCPPSLGLLSYVSLVAATHILIPVQTEYKALRGTELLLQTIGRVKRRANKDIKIAGVIPTMHKARTVQGDASLQAIKEQLSQVGKVLDTIPRATDFANASQAHKPLALFVPKHPAVEVLQSIAKELKAI
jgi:chromosome partitioning protein